MFPNKADRHKSRAPRKQRRTDGPTDQPTERLIELRHATKNHTDMENQTG